MNNLSYDAFLKLQEKKQHSWPFFLAAVLAISLAIAGWGKLRYGLSFIDEGMYLTDGWRLANGDKLFPDANRFAGSFYHVFSSWVFYILPDAGVLTVRRVQYFLNLVAIGTLLFTFLRNEPPARIIGPGLASTPFLYLGLDPTGMGTSLNYYTITSFFYILYITAVIGYWRTENRERKLILAFISGLLITAAGISYLAVGAAGILFLLTPLLLRTTLPKSDVIAYFSPAILYPLIIHPNFEMHFNALQATLEGRAGTAFIMPYTLPHLLHAALFISLGLCVSRIKDKWLFYFSCFTLMALLTISIETRGFGLLPLFWNGWFKAPGLVACLNAAGASALIPVLLVKLRAAEKKRWAAPSIIILGFFLYACLFSLTSSLGILLMLSSSVLLWTGAGWILTEIIGKGRGIALLAALILPSAWALIVADHKFTYFDKSPAMLDTVIEEGPAKGIHTNQVNAFVERTIRKAIDAYSQKGDLILSFDQTPMVFFLSKRRPALDHSWIGITGGNTREAQAAIQKMIVTERLPTLALHWQNKFLWIPDSEKLESFSLSGFSPSTEQPILDFVRSNMNQIATINLGELPMVEIYKLRSQNQPN